jgi:uncharacterized RmlC-like cupin family protein
MEPKENQMSPLDSATCRVVRMGDSVTGKQQLQHAVGISTETAGARGISLQQVIIPALAKAKAHKHEGHETAIYILSGASRMRYGAQLEQELSVRAGDFLYIPADMPHMPFNLSDSEPCVAIVARTDPQEQESVRLLPELDDIDLTG